jgi:hypothetical protein
MPTPSMPISWRRPDIWSFSRHHHSRSARPDQRIPSFRSNFPRHPYQLRNPPPMPWCWARLRWPGFGAYSMIAAFVVPRFSLLSRPREYRPRQSAWPVPVALLGASNQSDAMRIYRRLKVRSQHRSTLRDKRGVISGNCGSNDWPV